ncbi:U6 snRNA phosphodiesterase Usb1 [Pyrenochaeta sp. MPI-SDFR-AT-0127]|nr:U6 snRNA phosphodiesterase Usb1 [Pyrenochaeta sp. MPI-SDFR-AT-0127]
MSLVQYPDSDSDADDKNNAIAAQPLQQPTQSALKRKHSQGDLPPLPAAFHDLYTANARVSTSDNPSLHGGRKRAVPHVQGNWPSHVYLEWVPSQTESDSLHGLIQHVKDRIEHENATRSKKVPVPDIVPSLQSELGASLPLHVSLSRTLQIKTEDREAFLETLSSGLRKAAVRAFHFDFRNIKWVPNFERNRWFLVLNIKKPEHDELNRLLIACNEAAETIGHSRLYMGDENEGPKEDPGSVNNSKRRKSQHDEHDQIDCSEFFHISIAWNLTEPDPEWISLIQSVDVDKFVQSPQAMFDTVKARIGNVVHNIALGTRRSNLGKGGGHLGLG